MKIVKKKLILKNVKMLLILLLVHGRAENKQEINNKKFFLKTEHSEIY